MEIKKILVLQTASIGDVILATSLIEKLHKDFANYSIDILVKNPNQSLFTDHPFIRKIIVWNKKNGKYKNLFNIIKQVRQERYTYIFNLQRFLSSGLITVLAGAKITAGFNKNPLSMCFKIKKSHIIKDGMHEIDRNLLLIEDLCEKERVLPKLYPSKTDYEKVNIYNKGVYYTLSPSSLWITKRLSINKWANVFKHLKEDRYLYLLGSKGDWNLCEEIRKKLNNNNIINLAGELSLLQSAALIKNARMNFTCDSSPLHLCSAMNSPVTAVFCSTVKTFGFYPLSDNSVVIETKENLQCRPCNLHGKKECPLKHFKCSETIDEKELIARL